MESTAIACTLTGCVGCVAGMELIQRQVPNSAHLLTLVAFLFIVIEGGLSRSFTYEKRHIPFQAYIKIVLLFFAVNTCYNYAYDFDVSFPVAIVFKSSSLLANVLLGFFLRRHVYSFRQLFSATVVSMGVIVFTLASWQPSSVPRSLPLLGSFPIPPFIIGVSLLFMAVFISAYLGLLQEDLYRTYGRHSREAMFFVHFLSLPFFFLVAGDIVDAAVRASATRPIVWPWPVAWLSSVPYMPDVPEAWGYIAGVTVLQWICVSYVSRLTSVTSSFNVTMVITIRKYLSLFLSVYLFSNPFNVFHVIGSLFVLIGSLMFSGIIG